MSRYNPSPFFSASKPTLFSDLRSKKDSTSPTVSKKPEPTEVKSSKDSGSGSKAGASSPGGLGFLSKTKSTTSTGQATATGGSSSGGSPGLVHVIPSSEPSSPPPQVSHIFPLSSSPPMATGIATPTNTATPFSKETTLPNNGASPTVQTTTTPVPKPRAKKLSVPTKLPDQPKPQARSFSNEEQFEIINASDCSGTTTPPVPLPRKNNKKKEDPVPNNGVPTVRQRIYSKGTKEYNKQKKAPPINLTPPSTTPPTVKKATDFPALPFHHFTLDESPRSIINIIDLDIQTSIRSQYLTKEDLEGNGEDSDEETNKQIGILEAAPLVNENISTIENELTTTGAVSKGKSPAPPKPPRKKSRSPSPVSKYQRTRSGDNLMGTGILMDNDPTIALTKSKSFFEEKSKKGFFSKSPFTRRKSKNKEPWELPREEPDSESIVSESGILSPVEFPLHKKKEVKDFKNLLAKDPLIDVNKRDPDYNTPIHCILKKAQRRPQRSGLIMVLLQTGRVDVDSRDCGDNTPLHLAAQINDYKCAALLLAFDANPFVLNKDGRSPIDFTDFGSPLHNLLSQQVQPSPEDYLTLTSFRDSTVPVDPQELENERIGKLLQPDKIAGFVRKLNADIQELEHQPITDSCEEGPKSLKQLTQSEEDLMKCLQDQKFYLANWKKTSGSRILFLDGGGVRGLVQIEILMELEKRTGRKVTDLFDWIVGTSTGAIVALGLVYGGKTLQEMRNLYFIIKNEVFGGAGIAGTFMSMPQRTKKFEKLLKNLFGDKIQLGDVTHPRVMICAVNKQKSPLRLVFFNNFMEDEPELRDILVWKAARATSAAPMYFTEFDGKYVDGGVMANNPCDIAMTHIAKYEDRRGLPPRIFAIAVSIGTGIFPSRNLGDGDSKEYGLLNLRKQISFVKELTQLFAEAVANSEVTAQNFAQRCKKEIPFMRLNPKLRGVISPGETDDEKLIDMLMDTKQYLVQPETQQEFTNIVKIFKKLQSDK